ncbi:MAG TPA: HlyD family efflux transporter periplasmic adaptor subunit, partial [bacterium]|nr:HlyD family efflux transporter periplasmic adaptor subunit [bacterium]
AKTILDGTEVSVNEINIENGDSLNKSSSSNSNETPIIIGDLGTMKAKVEINEVDIVSVQIGQNASMTFDAVDELKVTGKVEKIDALGTLNSGVVSYNVVISFDSLDPRIKPQMSVSAEIITGSKEDILIVSNSAIKAQNGENYVQIMHNDVPEKRKIKVGIANDTNTEVVSGLSAGDVVVTQTINANSASNSSSSSSSSSNSNKSNNNDRGGPPGMMGF